MINEAHFHELDFKTLSFSGSNCWLCGTEKNIVKHHAIDIEFKPTKNVIIPLCQNCHNKIHLKNHIIYRIDCVKNLLKEVDYLMGELKNEGEQE